MNFSKIFMRNFKYFKCISLNNNVLKLSNGNSYKLLKNINIKSFSTENHEGDELETDFDGQDSLKSSIYARNILFENSNDPLISQLKKCASVGEVFEIFTKNEFLFNVEHLTQAVLVLQDFQQIYHMINGIDYSTKEFSRKLHERLEFQQLLNLIQLKIDEFSLRNLTHIQYYLRRLLGFDELENNELIQIISWKIKKKLLEDFNLNDCSRFFRVIFHEKSLRPFYLAVDLIPQVLQEIDFLNNNLEKLEDLTLCLLNINALVRDDDLNAYKSKIHDFLDKNLLTANDFDLVVKILQFLNLPTWRHRNNDLLNRLSILIEDKCDLLSLSQLLIFYQVLFKTQEPASLLNKLQRRATQFLQADVVETTTNRLKLISSLIYFSPPSNRQQYESILRRDICECTNLNQLILIRKILTFIKVSDAKLCEFFWDKVLELLENKNLCNLFTVLTMSSNYLNFNGDVEFRHKKFELFVTKQLYDIKNSFFEMFPSQITLALAFSLIYSHDDAFINYLISKLEEDFQQLNQIDCYRISHSLSIVDKLNLNRNKFKSRLENLLNKSTANLIEKSVEGDRIEFLIRAYILRQNSKKEANLFNLMLEKLIAQPITSKYLENVTYTLKMTNTLIPDVLNKLAEYIVEHKERILGFNVEKVVHLSYLLGYQPEMANELFDTAVDVIIRDQQRMSGLAFLESAMALCFFHKLPAFFIKSIFNVEFLDKLDAELVNCYFKDHYPHRVREQIMQLNRAVCLEYPESNVPWFHQKYIDELYKKTFKKEPSQNEAHLNIRNNLSNILLDSGQFQEHFIAPYGYHVDFLLSLDKNRCIVSPNSSDIKSKLAILVVPNNGFTQHFVQLKGKNQLKRRHLEMLGYNVQIINAMEYLQLTTAKDRIKFLENLLCLNDETKRNIENYSF